MPVPVSDCIDRDHDRLPLPAHNAAQDCFHAKQTVTSLYGSLGDIVSPTAKATVGDPQNQFGESTTSVADAVQSQDHLATPSPQFRATVGPSLQPSHLPSCILPASQQLMSPLPVSAECRAAALNSQPVKAAGGSSWLLYTTAQDATSAIRGQDFKTYQGIDTDSLLMTSTTASLDCDAEPSLKGLQHLERGTAVQPTPTAAQSSLCRQPNDNPCFSQVPSSHLAGSFLAVIPVSCSEGSPDRSPSSDDPIGSNSGSHSDTDISNGISDSSSRGARTLHDASGSALAPNPQGNGHEAGDSEQQERQRAAHMTPAEQEQQHVAHVLPAEQQEGPPSPTGPAEPTQEERMMSKLMAVVEKLQQKLFRVESVRLLAERRIKAARIETESVVSDLRATAADRQFLYTEQARVFALLQQAQLTSTAKQESLRSCTEELTKAQALLSDRDAVLGDRRRRLHQLRVAARAVPVPQQSSAATCSGEEFRRDGCKGTTPARIVPNRGSGSAGGRPEASRISIPLSQVVAAARVAAIRGATATVGDGGGGGSISGKSLNGRRRSVDCASSVASSGSRSLWNLDIRTTLHKRPLSGSSGGGGIFGSPPLSSDFICHASIKDSETTAAPKSWMSRVWGGRNAKPPPTAAWGVTATAAGPEACEQPYGNGRHRSRASMDASTLYAPLPKALGSCTPPKTVGPRSLGSGGFINKPPPLAECSQLRSEIAPLHVTRLRSAVVAPVSGMTR